MSRRLLRLVAATSTLALLAGAASAQTPVPRANPAAGAIVAAKGGEELKFVQESAWRPAELRQSLIDGDTLRTNAIGNLAILFADQTQIRVGRNSTLTVRDVAAGAGGSTQLDLQSGNVWARASRGGSGVDVRTPAAVAAIRGTDWSLSVEGSRTSLIVLEGVVELRNPQGSVTVRQGEGAVASIGQAPTKFVLVNSNDREQMLFYLTLRDAFTSLPTTSLEGPALRQERARIEAVPPGSRSAEDWLSLAEIAPYLDGRAAAIRALAEARGRPLSASQRARADLAEAVIRGSQQRWTEAAALFARAERGVDPKRRVLAAYGRYVAQSLADPKKVFPEPRIGSNEPLGALAHAYIVAFRQDLNAASEVLKAAEKRFPNDTRIAVAAAQVAFALNRREEMRASINRAAAIDPDDPNVIAAHSGIRGDVDGEVNAALADLRRAAAIAPGNSNIWNAIGLFESDRDRPLAAEEALRRAIAEDPESPVSYANLAFLLLDQNRVDEAGALIDKALALDPAFHVGYVARGRYLLQKGEAAAGLEAILAGSAANPAYSQGLLAAAIAYYQNGEEAEAQQALDNADRLDPNDPIVSIARTAIAIDQYRADEAVVAAREAVRRFRQRGGDFAGLAVNKQGGSFPAQAYRFLSLDEWGRFYGDRTFDPFIGSSYFDQSAARRDSLLVARPTLDAVQGLSADLTAYNLILQGLFFDPLAVSGRIGRLDLLRRPFLDAEMGGSMLFRGGRIGWETEAQVQAFSNDPIPTSVALTAGRTRLDAKDAIDRDSLDNASFFIGAAPSAADRFLVFGSATKNAPGLATINETLRTFAGRQDTTTLQLGGGWSHSFADRNVLTAAIYAYRGLDKRFSQQSSLEAFPIFVASELWQGTKIEGVVAALNHSIGFGDWTLRYGIESQNGETRARSLGRNGYIDFTDGTTEIIPVDDSASASFRAGRLYADLFWRPSDRFEAQAGVQRTFLDIEGQNDDIAVSPRVGVGVSPVEGQWLRAAYRREGSLALPFTLSPITTVGLVPNVLPVSLGGETNTLALRWDAEWSPHVFTAVEYQRQRVDALSLPVSNTFDSLSVDKARVDRLAATANVWLGSGIGLFGTVGFTDTEITAGDGLRNDVPFIPGRFARAGLTFVHPSRLKLTVAETYYGDLKGSLFGAKLDDYWTTDASITWETADRRLLFGVTLLNLLDADYELAPGIPGAGRTVAASVRARF
ncbi:FecR domain-containing protein [Microvirga pudoricolor]|uniref:FecR domain-containing protein n=1 Tax=Microvirga pudoricolor TaxID=2778729 RepID=UPI00194F9A89|nr:FecR domain-containing protein [Microvirga pudoricolor]MBM6593704.1 FecR domain-containing protein [Microvirga pudoricolor]